jgi:HEAT repeat protein
MMRVPFRVVIGLVAWVALPLWAQAPADEGKWLAVLQSGANRVQKEDACRNLKRVGTAAAVPTLAELLTDGELAQDARDALTVMPCAAAGQALLAALDAAAGPLKAGIIDALAARREPGAVTRLVPLLLAADVDVARSAALALGTLGGAEAVRGLDAALAGGPPALRAAYCEGLLRAADQLRATGDRAAADALCRRLAGAGQSAAVRTAAWTGLLAPGEPALAHLEQALDSADPAAEVAVVQCLVGLEGGPAVTQAVAERLPRLAPALRVALLASLARRGEAAAAAAVVVECGSADPRVRVAALAALGELGDASHVTLLTERAAATSGDERDTARAALCRLRRGEVTGSLLGMLRESSPAAKAEVMLALAQRGDAAACDALLAVARGADEAAAASALEALGTLAGAAQFAALTEVLVQATGKVVREAATTAVVSAGRRPGDLDAATATVLRAVEATTGEARAALLRAAGELGGAGAFARLRLALDDADPAVRTMAVRTLADVAGPEALPELLKLATASAEPTHRVLALRGYWRLVGLAEMSPLDERLRWCREGLAACTRPEERRLGLGQVSRLPLPAALELALAAEADEAVRAEAQLASVQVCRQIMASDRTAAGALLQRLATAGAVEQVKTEAKAALEALYRLSSYIMPWLATGPYRQEGKECKELFDIPFPAEEGVEKADWKPAPVPADPGLAWQVDLGPLTGGNHAVLYVKTRVFVPREQPINLAIGVDDGIKLWINGEGVHANNAVRGLNPDEDKAKAVLRQGWNDLLAKITQHTAGCGVCVRVTTPDGALVDGLRVDPLGKE